MYERWLFWFYIFASLCIAFSFLMFGSEFCSENNCKIAQGGGWAISTFFFWLCCANTVKSMAQARPPRSRNNDNDDDDDANSLWYDHEEDKYRKRPGEYYDDDGGDENGDEDSWESYYEEDEEEENVTTRRKANTRDDQSPASQLQSQIPTPQSNVDLLDDDFHPDSHATDHNSYTGSAHLNNDGASLDQGSYPGGPYKDGESTARNSLYNGGNSVVDAVSIGPNSDNGGSIRDASSVREGNYHGANSTDRHSVHGSAEDFNVPVDVDHNDVHGQNDSRVPVVHAENGYFDDSFGNVNAIDSNRPIPRVGDVDGPTIT